MRILLVRIKFCFFISRFRREKYSKQTKITQGSKAENKSCPKYKSKSHSSQNIDENSSEEHVHNLTLEASVLDHLEAIKSRFIQISKNSLKARKENEEDSSSLQEKYSSKKIGHSNSVSSSSLDDEIKVGKDEALGDINDTTKVSSQMNRKERSKNNQLSEALVNEDNHGILSFLEGIKNSSGSDFLKGKVNAQKQHTFDAETHNESSIDHSDDQAGSESIKSTNKISGKREDSFRGENDTNDGNSHEESGDKAASEVVNRIEDKGSLRSENGASPSYSEHSQSSSKSFLNVQYEYVDDYSQNDKEHNFSYSSEKNKDYSKEHKGIKLESIAKENSKKIKKGSVIEESNSKNDKENLKLSIENIPRNSDEYSENTTSFEPENGEVVNEALDVFHQTDKDSISSDATNGSVPIVIGNNGSHSSGEVSEHLSISRFRKRFQSDGKDRSHSSNSANTNQSGKFNNHSGHKESSNESTNRRPSSSKSCREIPSSPGASFNIKNIHFFPVQSDLESASAATDDEKLSLRQMKSINDEMPAPHPQNGEATKSSSNMARTRNEQIHVLSDKSPVERDAHFSVASSRQHSLTSISQQLSLGHEKWVKRRDHVSSERGSTKEDSSTEDFESDFEESEVDEMLNSLPTSESNK